MNFYKNCLIIIVFFGSFTTVYSQTLGNGAFDQDGNNYNTVVIGNQEWFQENLKTSKYSNGDVIPNVADNAQWSLLTTGAWANYNNDNLLNTIYGKLYNYYTISDTRALCPTGWRVPSDSDWNELALYLDSSANVTCVNCSQSTTVGGMLKDSGILYWNTPNVGATNSSNFKSLPAGARYPQGNFNYLGYSSNYATSTQDVTGNYFFRNNVTINSALYKGIDTSQKGGLSIRCIKSANMEIIDSTNKINFHVYPNPASSIISIEINPIYIGISYFVNDQLGRMVLSGKIDASNSIIDISQLENNIYILHFGSNTSDTFKIMKK